LDSTPTDEPLSRPLSDLKLSLTDMNKVAEKIRNERKASADVLATERKPQPPNSLWLDSCSSSAPNPVLELDKESLG